MAFPLPRGLFSLTLLLLTAASLHADETYCYEENNLAVAPSPITTRDSLIGCLTLGDELTGIPVPDDWIPYDDVLGRLDFSPDAAETITARYALVDPQDPNDAGFTEQAEDEVMNIGATGSQDSTSTDRFSVWSTVTFVREHASSPLLPLGFLTLSMLSLLTYVYGVARRIWRACAADGESGMVVIRPDRHGWPEVVKREASSPIPMGSFRTTPEWIERRASVEPRVKSVL